MVIGSMDSDKLSAPVSIYLIYAPEKKRYGTRKQDIDAVDI